MHVFVLVLVCLCVQECVYVYVHVRVHVSVQGKGVRITSRQQLQQRGGSCSERTIKNDPSCPGASSGRTVLWKTERGAEPVCLLSSFL